MRVIFALSVILLTGTSCGWLQAGNGAVGVDARPDGDVVAQGNFSGLNGSTVSGAVSIYRATNGTDLTLRIEGLSISPSETTFRMTAKVSGASDYVTNLRFVAGNTNYATGVSSPATVTRVILESLTRAQLPEVAAASLTSP